MRDLLANLVSRLRASSRQERLYVALGAVVLLVALRFGITWLVDYRREVKEDIQLTADRLANAKRTVMRGPELERQLAALKQRYDQTAAHLVPGDTPTLAAAVLQERVSNLAAQKSVSLQTTQVMRDEAMGPFRKVSLRITANGELRHLADFLADLEFGDLRVSVPFIELSRRGGGRRESGPRAVSATIEIAGIVQGTALAHRGGGVTPAAATEPATDVPAPAAPLPDVAPGAPEVTEVPSDPLGTANLTEPPQ
jgi:Tfp pilus assembly protein PilO